MDEQDPSRLQLSACPRRFVCSLIFLVTDGPFRPRLSSSDSIWGATQGGSRHFVRSLILLVTDGPFRPD